MTSRFLCVVAVTALLVSTALAADKEGIPLSNVEGKKLIRVSQALVWHIPVAEMPAKVAAWQETGYDGLCFPLSTDPEPGKADEDRKNMAWRWWDVDPRAYEEFKSDIDTFQSVKDWGRLTDNFMWMASHVEGHKPPDWFSDADWDVVLANARLGARIANELGFKGILFDWEGYGGGAYGVWRQPWDYHLYATSDYTIEKRNAPRSFDEVAAKVRERGRQWIEALCEGYPGLVLVIMPGLYEGPWARANEPRSGGSLAQCDVGLWPAFVDGILKGLDERATLVSFSESTYLDSQYRDMLVWRDFTKEQALTLATDPELARRRISFAPGIWTDAGYGTPRFSATDGQANQRDAERHKHATHNALAAGDRYAWQWGEWGKEGESNFMTTAPTDLMRQYWQANVDAHTPQDLGWEIVPYIDQADYTTADAETAEKGAAFLKGLENNGYKTAVALPEHWKFRFDPETKVRYSNWTTPEYDDASWFLINGMRCWQSEGTHANGPGVYRVAFDVPKDVDPEKQEVVLAFSGLGHGEAHLYFNGGWISYMKGVIDVPEAIKPGERNQATIVFLNKSGPGGLMGPVRLLVRDRK